MRELTKIQGALSAGHVIVDVRYTEGVHRRLTHSNTEQRYEKYREHHRGDLALYPLLRKEITLAVLGRIGLRHCRRRGPPARK